MITFYETENFNKDHTKFGGLIYPSDFNTDYNSKNNAKGSLIASRIIADRMFDNQCRNNRELLERKEGK